MEISKALRTGYFQKLNGNVMNGVNPVPVFDAFALPTVSYPYILLSSQTSSQVGTKTCKYYDATILIDIVTGDINPIGRSQAETIADQIEMLVNPDSREDIDLGAYGYDILTTYRRSDTDLGDKNQQFYIFRKLMRYEHKISKL